MIKPTDSFSGLLRSLDRATGYTDRSKGQYIVRSIDHNTHLLKAVWRRFIRLIQQNPHFSEEERESGENILYRLKAIQDQAKTHWLVVFTTREEIIRFGSWDQDFRDYGHSRIILAKVALSTYTTIQWNVAHPDKILPKEFCIKNQMRHGQPARFTSEYLELQVNEPNR